MESKPKRELLRITSVDGKPALDATGKANGRGVYLCAVGTCFDLAKKKKAISRGLSIEGLTEQDYEALRGAFESYSYSREDSL
jgi:predicted RNA-binding protein YlxR (DUF448 family)